MRQRGYIKSHSHQTGLLEIKTNDGSVYVVHRINIDYGRSWRTGWYGSLWRNKKGELCFTPD